MLDKNTINGIGKTDRERRNHKKILCTDQRWLGRALAWFRAMSICVAVHNIHAKYYGTHFFYLFSSNVSPTQAVSDSLHNPWSTRQWSDRLPVASGKRSAEVNSSLWQHGLPYCLAWARPRRTLLLRLSVPLYLRFYTLLLQFNYWRSAGSCGVGCACSRCQNLFVRLEGCALFRPAYLGRQVGVLRPRRQK